MSKNALAPMFGPDGSPIPAAVRVAARAHGQQMSRAFKGASWSDPDFAGWNPNLYSPHSAYSPERNVLAGRLHDLARNDGWVSAAVTKKTDAIIGSNWLLFSTPNAKSLGLDPDVVAEFAQDVEAAWKDFANDSAHWIDAGRRQTFGGLMATAFRHRMLDGEALGAIMYDASVRGNGYKTCVQMLHPDRLSNPYGLVDTLALRSGVALGEFEQPVGYWIRSSHPGDEAVFNPHQYKWDYWQRETDFGRQLVFHSYNIEAAGQYRGQSILNPIVKQLRNMSRYNETELQAAILNAVMAAIVETPFDQDQMAMAMSGGEPTNGASLDAYNTARLAYHMGAPLDLGGAKVGFTFPGEKVTLTKPGHPNSVFEHYTRAGLRNIASVVGLSYEQLSADWSQSNYSSARGAIIEVWRSFIAEKDKIGDEVAQPIYAAWFEEALARGKFKLPKGAPGFRQAKAAWLSAEWIGPARGWVDPLKEAEAGLVRIAGGLSTLRRECSEQGLDYRDVIAQRKRERDELTAAGLDPNTVETVAQKVRGNIGQGQKEAQDDGSAGAKDGSAGGSDSKPSSGNSQ